MIPVSFARLLALVVLAVGVPACAGGPLPAEDKRPETLPWAGNVIIKFRDSAFEPTRGDYLIRLSREIGVTLVYVRPMSGGAHVLAVGGGVRDVDMDRLVALLRARADVLYAERDRQVRAIGGK